MTEIRCGLSIEEMVEIVEAVTRGMSSASDVQFSAARHGESPTFELLLEKLLNIPKLSQESLKALWGIQLGLFRMTEENNLAIQKYVDARLPGLGSPDGTEEVPG